MTRLTPESVLQNFASRLVSAWRSDSEEQIAPAASTLSCFLSSSVDGSRSSTVTLPALEVRPRKNRNSFLSQLQHTSSKKRALHQIDGQASASAAENLGRTRRFNKLDVPQAPSTLLRNLTVSFQLMIDEALRRTALALMRRSLLRAKAGKVDAATARAHAEILKLLCPPSPSASNDDDEEENGAEATKKCRSPVRIHAAATNWVTLPPRGGSTPPPPESRAGAAPSPPSSPFAAASSGGGGASALVLPLIFEAVMDADVLGTGAGPTLALRVPGTVSAKFNRLTSRIETAAVVLDTDALHRLMAAKAAALVERAAAAAFAVAARTLRDGDAAAAGDSLPTATTAPGSPSGHSDVACAAPGPSEAEAEADVDTRRMPPPPPRPPLRSSPGTAATSPPPKKRRLDLDDAAAVTSLSSPCGEDAKLALVNPAA